MSEFEGERISKRISRSGYCSRRDAERLIEKGKVRVNGKRISSPALNVTDDDIIIVNGTQLTDKELTRLWLYNKPVGLITSHHDPEGRPTVFEALAERLPRVISVGRLDLNSEGLLLLTNDGELARYLELPTTGWLRRYRVRTQGFPSAEALRDMKKGITIDEVTYRGISVKREAAASEGTNVWSEVTLSEGKNREIRRVFDHFGCPVNRLIRLSYGAFQLGNLPSGEFKEVERKALQNALGKGYPLS